MTQTEGKWRLLAQTKSHFYNIQVEGSTNTHVKLVYRACGAIRHSEELELREEEEANLLRFDGVFPKLSE